MKAVLAIDMDMPKRCGECKFRSPELNPCEELMWLCKLKDDFIDRRTRPDWCPLRPTPNKKEENNDGTHFSWHSNDWWNAGWNACLKEITGEDDAEEE